jgi:L-alanine-DL-glutamate epimerase-like enolase superfamily enzyme
MSTIRSLRLHRRSIPLVRPFVTAVRTATEIDVLLVEAEDSSGRVGWGEAPTSWRVTGESPESVAAAVQGPLLEAVRGGPVDDPAGLSRALERAAVRNSAARMAVDCALYDLAAQNAGVPLHRYLQGSSADVTATDMTLSAVVDDAGIGRLAETAQRHRDDGFRALKVKVGAGGDDVEAMRAVRAAVGGDVVLRADANQGWDPQQAVSVIRAWEDAGLGIQLIEQPVHRDDIDGLAFVTAHVETPVLADESVWTLREAREVIARRAVDMINVKLAKTGGLREGLAIVDEAWSNGVRVIVGCMMESQVGIAAAAALASVIDSRWAGAVAGEASISGAVAHDLDAGQWLASAPVQGGIRYERDEVRLSPGAGLGIAGPRP